MADTVSFLGSLKLQQYAPAIEENGVDGPMLLVLVDGDGLSELGITSKIHAAKIKDAVRAIPAASKYEIAFVSDTNADVSD